MKAKPGDLTASDFGIDVPSVLGEVGSTFLSKDEREMINKGVAHLTEDLSLEDEANLIFMRYSSARHQSSPD